MEIRQCIRLVVFGYENFLPNILSFWVSAILPEIMVHNFGITDKEQISANCGYFFSSFYMGIFFGAFLWPSIMFKISKRNGVFIGLLGMCLFNYLVGISTHLGWVYAFRFMTGIFHNLNSVGKDFIFQFAKPKYRQYAFSLKTLFGFIAGFLCPFVGYLIYNHFNKDFRLAMNFITLIFAIGLVLFIIVFYFDFKAGDATFDEEIDEEESRGLLAKMENDPSKQKGLLYVFKLCVKNTYMRNLSIVYLLTNGAYKASTMIAIIYMETPWRDAGYGITSANVSDVALIAFIPAAFLLLASPQFVPKYVSYKSFIQFFIVALSIAIILFPLVRDLIPDEKKTQYAPISLYLLGFLFMSIPKLYSPFINYNLNNAVDKYSRTSLNSITFILTSGSGAFFTTAVAPALGWSLYNPLFTGYLQYSKYIAFIMLDLGLIAALWILRKL